MRLSPVRAALAAAVLTVATHPEPARADLSIDTRLGQAKMLAGQKSQIYLRVSVKGLVPTQREHRPPLNLALVIDRSGSMAGARIERAREAALLVLARLRPDDIVSVIAFDHNVETIVPAARVRDQEALAERIKGLKPGGRTAIHAGVLEGLNQVLKHRTPHLANRIVLLSDGLANVGPSTPNELAELGRKAGSNGVSVTTIGLGLDYNEDLMTKLALASDGNHAFVEKPEDLARIFKAEFGDVLASVAQEIDIEVRVKPGYRPVRVLGRAAEIAGDRVLVRMGQLAADQEKYIVIELEGTPDGPGKAEVAEVVTRYHDAEHKVDRHAARKVAAEISASAADVEASIDAEVMTSVTIQIATEESERAVDLRDKGKIDEARQVLEKNSELLRTRARQYAPKGQEPASTPLGRLSERYEQDAKKITSQDWDRNRKALRADQLKQKNQQSY